MSGSGDAAKTAWVERVLGLAVRGGVAQGGQPTAASLSGELGTLGRRIAAASGGDAALRESLAKIATEAQNAIKVSDLGAAAEALGRLREAMAPAGAGDLTRSAERAREAAAANTRGIAYPKLLLRWRDAQSLVAGNLASVGKSILARPDVQTDPRFKDVEKIVAALPQLVPKFGGQLEDVLDAGLNEGDGPNASRLAAQAIVAIDEYRQRLGAAVPLLELEKFLAKEMGQGVALHEALDEALVELKQEMSTRV